MLYERMKKYAVPASDPIDFLERYTRVGCGAERGKAYQEERVKDAFKDLEEYGYCMLSAHESATGDVVSWYPEGERPQQVAGNL